MRTAYVNEILYGDKEVVRGASVINKTIAENIPEIFDLKLQQAIYHYLTAEPTKSEGFHFFTRFCQFVVYFQHRPSLGITIEFMYFGTSPNVNDAWDYMMKLKKVGWEDETREKILEIAYEIKHDMYESHFEIAELKIKDHFNDPSSYS